MRSLALLVLLRSDLDTAASDQLPVASPPGSDATAEVCDNTCPLFSRDGHCDDGGPGSTFHICHLGSDCADCGPRRPAPLSPPAPPIRQIPAPPPLPPFAPLPSPPSGRPPFGPLPPFLPGRVCQSRGLSWDDPALNPILAYAKDDLGLDVNKECLCASDFTGHDLYTLRYPHKVLSYDGLNNVFEAMCVAPCQSVLESFVAAGITEVGGDIGIPFDQAVSCLCDAVKSGPSIHSVLKAGIKEFSHIPSCHTSKWDPADSADPVILVGVCVVGVLLLLLPAVWYWRKAKKQPQQPDAKKRPRIVLCMFSRKKAPTQSGQVAVTVAPAATEGVEEV